MKKLLIGAVVAVILTVFIITLTTGVRTQWVPAKPIQTLTNPKVSPTNGIVPPIMTETPAPTVGPTASAPSMNIPGTGGGRSDTFAPITVPAWKQGSSPSPSVTLPVKTSASPAPPECLEPPASVPCN